MLYNLSWPGVIMIDSLFEYKKHDFSGYYINIYLVNRNELIIWCKDNLNEEDWHQATIGFCFKNREDAIMFEMAWK